MLVSSDSGSEAESLQVCCRCFRLLSVVVGCRRLLSVVVVVVGCCRLSVLVGVQAIEAESMVDDDESAILETDGGWRVVGAGLDPWEKLRRTPEAQADLRARRMEQWVASLGRCGCAVSMCVCVAPSSAERLVMRCVAVGAGCRAGRPMSRCRCYFEARCRHRARACAMSFGLPC